MKIIDFLFIGSIIILCSGLIYFFFYFLKRIKKAKSINESLDQVIKSEKKAELVKKINSEQKIKVLALSNDLSGKTFINYLIGDLNQICNNKFEQISLDGYVDSQSTLGTVEHLGKLIDNYKIRRKYLNVLKKNDIDLIIFSSSPGFNFRVMKESRKLHIPCLYYILPDFYAWGMWRASKYFSLSDLIIAGLPFEYNLYKDKFGSGKLKCFGHPAIEYVYKETSNLDNQEIINNGAIEVGLLPGSREQEIRQHLPIMIDASKLIMKKKKNTRFVVITANDFSKSLADEIVAKRSAPEFESVFAVENKDRFKIMKNCDILICASGTVTLEAAILNVPMVILYKFSIFSELAVKALKNRRLNFVGLPNIIAEEQIVREFLQRKAKACNIADEALRIINNNNEAEKIRKDLETKVVCKAKVDNLMPIKRASEEFLERFCLINSGV